MAKQQLYLHIGTVKTGTTALQRFLYSNSEVLRKKGIIYPRNKDNHFAHHRLSWSLRAKTGLDRWNWPDDLGTPEQEWNYVLDQLTELNGLISSEDFFWCLPEFIAEIKTRTSDYHVKLVVYWRRRDTLEDSWYNQLIKGGGIAAPPSCRQRLTSKRELDVWAGFFGKENIILRPYERGQLVQGDVLSDFLYHVLGLELTDEFTLPEKEVNTRLHRVVVEYKRMINWLPLFPAERRKTGNPLREVSIFFSQQGRKDYPVFSPRQRLELIEEYAAENAAIAREYLGCRDGRLFYDPLPDPSEDWQPYDQLLEDDARTINEYLAGHHPEAMEIILRGILAAVSPCGSNNAREAALRLLPGIEACRIHSVLVNGLTSPGNGQTAWVSRDKVDEIYASRAWKAGMVLNRIYNKMPAIIRKPALAAAKGIYQMLNLSGSNGTESG